MTPQYALTLASTISDKYRSILSPSLVGFYVHGSLAFDCFNGGSDIDFLAVTDREPTQTQKEALISVLLELDGEAPKKGFEMSVVDVRNAINPQHPIPYYLHFSNDHKEKAKADLTAYCRFMNGLDHDLAAHFTVTRKCGITLYGPPAADIFSPVPWRDYIDSITGDICGAKTDIVEDPAYITLNLCRVCAAIEKHEVISKAGAAVFAKNNIPEKYLPIIEKACEMYLAGNAEAFTYDEAALTDFALYMLKRIGDAKLTL